MIALNIELYSPRKHFILVSLRILSHVHPLLFLYFLEPFSVFGCVWCVCCWGQRACLCRESQRTTFDWYSLSTSLEMGSILHKPARVVGPEHRQFLLSRAATSSFMWILEIWTPSFMPLYPFPWPSLRFYSTLSLCVCVSLSQFPPWWYWPQTYLLSLCRLISHIYELLMVIMLCVGEYSSSCLIGWRDESQKD